MSMQQHFVTFYSPGSFVAEETRQPIDAWSVPTALELSRSIVERYNSRPYGFRFSTRTRGDADLDSKVTATSPMHYIAGRVETIEEIEARNDPTESILRSNMRGNGWARVVVTESPWRHCGRLDAGDVVLNERGEAIHTEPTP